jgi:glycosyltransferase involved in cell wall biosynthesis
MKVSVILTSYNKAKFLRDAIASVLAQTLADWELLIIDDHSTDDSWLIIETAAKLDSRIKALQTDIQDIPGEHKVELNRYTHNINLGLKLAEGDHISYLCDDDLFLPRRLEIMANYLDSNPTVQICYGIQEIRFVDGETEFSGGYRFSPQIQTIASGNIDHSSVMHRKSLLDEVGYWPESLDTWRMGDAAFWNKINIKYPFYLATDTEPTDCHRYNELSVSYALDHPKETTCV